METKIKSEGMITGNADEPRSLVAVFLRGGADGLNIVAPVGDDTYYAARPQIGVSKKSAVPLDGIFAFNPWMKGLKPAYDEGNLVIVHGAGSEDSTRSHFEAQDLMEHGGIVAGGWLGRFLRYRKYPARGALSAITMGAVMPECLRGAPSATVMRKLEDFTLGGDSSNLTREIARLFEPEQNDLGDAARDTLEAMERIEKLRGTEYHSANGAEYPDEEFAAGLKQVARLIKARVGLEAVSIDLNGWDSHFAQETLMNPLMKSLSDGLAAFYRDMGKMMETTTVVVMTEFGRRVQENTAFGTDHGRGSVMFAMGGGVRGGRVICDWKGLKKNLLDGPGDLPVTFNYRDVLAPILKRHGSGDDFSRIFPEYNVEPIGLYA